MAKVIDISQVREDRETEKQFVSLISDDMESGVGIEEIPVSVFDRVRALREKAKINAQEVELLEG